MDFNKLTQSPFRGIAGMILRAQGKPDSYNERIKFLTSVQGQVLAKDIETFARVWAEKHKLCAYDELWAAAKEFREGLISEEGFLVKIREFSQSKVDKDDLTALALQILAES